MKINYLLLIVFLYKNLSAFGQNTQPPDVPSITPPSANAVSLGRFGDIPVGYYNGIPQIDIPLTPLTINGGFTLPISLSYHASGVKLDDLPSHVGMNWSLNAGGTITKATRGIDDFKGYSVTGTNFENVGWLGAPPLPDMNTISANPNQYCVFRYNAADGKIDTEPDLFFYNVAGVSGKFIFNKNKSIMQIPHKNTLINLTSVNTSNIPSLTSWEIYDEKGNRYVFAESGNETAKRIDNSSFPDYLSACYLTDIYSVTGDHIIFNYITEENQYITNISQDYKTLGINFSSNTSCNSNFTQSNIPQNSIIKVQTKLLSSITYKGYSISFSYSNSGISSGIKKLDLVQYYFDNTLYKKYQLLYSIESTKDRFWLTGLKEMDINNNAVSKDYVLNYKDKELLPPRLSYKRDGFGFYNDNLDASFAPKIPNQLVVTGPAIPDNRSVISVTNPIKILYGSLEEIIYPTRGKTKFEFEPHSFRKNRLDLFNEIGAGIRIKSITNFENDNLTILNKQNIEYTDGFIMMYPQFYNFTTTGCVSTCNSISSKSNCSIGLSNSAMGSMVGYDRVSNSNSNWSDLYEYINILAEKPNHTVDTAYINLYLNFSGFADYFRPKTLSCTEHFENGYLKKESHYSKLNSNYSLSKTIEYMPEIDYLEQEIGYGFSYPYCYMGPQYSQTSSACKNFVSDSYLILSGFVKTSSKITTLYDLVNSNNTSDFMQTIEDYDYDQLLVNKTITTDSKGRSVSNEITFRNAIYPYYKIALPVKKTSKLGAGTILESTDYKYVGNLPTEIYHLENNYLGNTSGNSSPLNKQTATYLTYNSNKFLTSYNSYNKPITNFIWDEGMEKFIAEFTNASGDQIAYTSFETNSGIGNFIFNSSGINTGISRTGQNSYNLNTNNSLSTTLSKQGKYKLSFWAMTGLSNFTISYSNNSTTTIGNTINKTFNGYNWVYYEYIINLTSNQSTNILINGTGVIDEIRLCPINASVKTYTHMPFFGPTSIQDERGHILTYHYDGFGRIYQVKDNEGNIREEQHYNYKP